MTANRAQLGPSQAFFDGVYSSISANNSRDVFFVYHKSVFSNAMCYRLGEVTDENVLDYKEEHKLDHCDGKNPQAAINDKKMAVVAFTSKSLFSSSNIKYTVGSFVHEKTVSWEKPKEACRGSNPCIAISGDTLILVYCNSSEIFYKLGQLSCSSMMINWTAEGRLANNAQHPCVAMNDRIFAVLYTDSGTSKLKTIVGEAEANNVTVGEIQDDSNGNIDPKDDYDGYYPSIGMFDDHSIIATHQKGTAAFRRLFARSGRIDTTNRIIDWNESRAGCIVLGAFSSVASISNNENIFAEVHSTNRLGGSTLWYEVGSVR